jgi:enterochelin esterase-like enzyme
MTSLDGVSLIHGWVVNAVPALAVAAVVVTVARRGRRWWAATVPVVVSLAGAAVTAAAWYLHHRGIVRDHYPKSFLVWTGEVLVAAAVAIVGWPDARWWRRIVAVAAVPLTAASTLVLMNAHYAYWPTVGDLLGRPLQHEISARALSDVLARQASRASLAPPAPEAAPTAPGPDTADPPPADPPPAPVDSAGGDDAAPAPPSVTTAAAPSPAAEPDPVASGAPAPAADRAAPAMAPDMAANRSAGDGGAGHSRRATEVAAGPTPAAMHGVLAPLDVPSTVSGFPARQGTLYLPPAFFDSPPPTLPVIVMVGGTPGGPQDWPRAGFAAQTADAYATRHHGVAPILAFVDHNGSVLNDTECVDGPAGQAETFLAVDVPRYLSETLHIPRYPSRWAIAGFSEGGTCALELAVRHPDAYGTFVDIAGDWAPNVGSEPDTLRELYGGDRAAMAAHDPANLLRPNRFRDLNGWFLTGASDGPHVDVAARLAAAARTAGIAVTRTVLPGAHNWQLATGAFRTALGALTRQLAGEAPAGTATAAMGTHHHNP